MSEPRVSSKTRAAVIGLGQMGRGIARNLDQAGLLVAAFDIQSDAFGAARFSGRVRDLTPAALVDTADILVFAVPSTDQIESFLSGAGVRSGQIVLDLTTSDPSRSRALAIELSKDGVAFVDAAMTGGAAGADAGTLTLMMGGATDDVSRCQPVIDTIASRAFRIGPVGAGHAMKLVHNMILHSSFLATCEGLRLAERAGIDPAMAVDVLNAGNARSFVTDTRFPRDILSGKMNARSRIANLEKDLGLAMDFASEQHASVPFGSLTRDVLSAALGEGYADTDFSYLFPIYDQLVGRLGEET